MTPDEAMLAVYSDGGSEVERVLSAEVTRLRQCLRDLARFADGNVLEQSNVLARVLARDCDVLFAAALALVTKLDALKPAIDNAFQFAAAHGQTYSGPNYGAEIIALRKLVKP